MAATEQPVQETASGKQEFAVENPATGEVIAHCPDLGAADIAAMARRGREVQPAWDALGFEGRGRILRRMQKWVIDHQDEVIAVIRSETGKTYEDALIAEISYGAAAFGFWAANAPKYLADEKVKSSAVLVKGKKLMLRHKPLGPDRRHRPVELPADELVRRLHPGAGRRQQRDPQAVARSRR